MVSPLDLKVPWPCGRDDHSACVKGGNYPLLVVVGGVGNQFNTLSDLWIFDVDSQNWKQVNMINIICINELKQEMTSLKCDFWFVSIRYHQ